MEITKVDQIPKDTVILDPAGEEHTVLSMDTTRGTDHDRWNYDLQVCWSKRKIKRIPFTAIKALYHLPELVKEKGNGSQGKVQSKKVEAKAGRGSKSSSSNPANNK